MVALGINLLEGSTRRVRNAETQLAEWLVPKEAKLKGMHDLAAAHAQASSVTRRDRFEGKDQEPVRGARGRWWRSNGGVILVWAAKKEG
jgi:hypothetical protein